MESSRSCQEDTEIHTVTLEEGENPTSAAEAAMEEYNEENPENKIDPNEARSSIYETAAYMKDLYKSKTGNSEIQPGSTVDVAIGDINGDGKPSIAITKIEDKSKIDRFLNHNIHQLTWNINHLFRWFIVCEFLDIFRQLELPLQHLACPYHSIVQASHEACHSLEL